MATLSEELTRVAKGVHDQVAPQLAPGVGAMVLLAHPSGQIGVALNIAPEHAVRLLRQLIEQIKNGAGPRIVAPPRA